MSDKMICYVAIALFLLIILAAYLISQTTESSPPADPVIIQ